ncbi:MAG: flagellar biosynthetic protein FliO [Chloroflexi bacterium]|nr:flagellar biosynthetic protein FliO [Chloroflexota bacterium]
MKDPRNRRRLMWLAGLGAALLASLVFISMFAPSANPGSTPPVLQPEPAATAAAAAAGAGDAASSSSGGGGFNFGSGDAVSLLLRLLLVAIIIGVSVVGLRWWGRRTSGPRSTTGFLRVVDTLAISNGRTIHLVALGDRVIAVGATAQQLTFLSELTGAEALSVQASAPRPGEQPPLTTFATELFHSMRAATRRTPRPPRDSVIGE